MSYASQSRFRVAIDGAQSTGKTTLLQVLREHYGDRYTYVGEAARTVAARFDVETTEDWEKLLGDARRLTEFFELEEQWLLAAEEAAPTDLIVDSSLFLIAAYRERFGCERRPTWQPYDLVLLCGLEADASDDGFRFLNGREEVDTLYRQRYAGLASDDVVPLPSGAERYAAAIYAVDRAELRG